MTPQEIAQIAKATTIVESVELSVAMSGITEFLKQMSKDQLAEVLATVTLPEDYSPCVENTDLRMAVLVMATRHISKKLLEDWRNKSGGMNRRAGEIEAIFFTNPFLSGIVARDACSAADIIEAKAEQTEKDEERNNLRLQAGNLNLLAGHCYYAQGKFKAVEVSR